MDCFQNDPNHLRQVHHTKGKKKGGNRSTKGAKTKLSTDPQSVAARERRHRISDRFKILQSLVPGGSKMDTVSMLEEAIQYVKFLKTQIWLHQAMMNHEDPLLFIPSDSLQVQSFYPSTATPILDQAPPPLYGFQLHETIMFSHDSMK